MSRDADDTVDRTADGHHIVVDGRRWRASDPSIPEVFRSELVSELMAARRAVGGAKRADDADAMRAARRRVQDAKLALGERGDQWWETPSEQGRHDRIAAAAQALLRHRDATSSICPSDVARVIGGSTWRTQLDVVRDVVGRLAREGVVVVTKGSDTVDVSVAKGPVRLRRGHRFE
ncbi:MAG: DUF3253 domain-containing protein [Ilumatobacteraceae bacterium]